VRVRPDGTVLEPVEISLGNYGTYARGAPRVAPDGENFLVTSIVPDPGSWYCTVTAVLISGSTGEVLSSTATGADTCLSAPVVFDGTNYLILSSEISMHLEGVLVSPTGAVLRTRFLLDEQLGYFQPDAAAVDGVVLVATPTDAMLVSGTGTVTDLDLPPAVAEGPPAVASYPAYDATNRSHRAYPVGRPEVANVAAVQRVRADTSRSRSPDCCGVGANPTWRACQPGGRS
jgi:hypothetical protein